jgi:hypothetical protein
MRTRTVSAIFAVGLALIGTACGGGEPAPPASPSPAFPSGSASASPTASGGMPTVPPGGELTEGRLRLEMSGAVRLEEDLTDLVTGIAAPPPGAFALVWSGGGAHTTTFGVGGASFVGTKPTTPTLVLTIAAQTDSGFSTWISSGGECRITIRTAESTAIDGRFACEELASSEGEMIDVSGEFRATG